MLNLIAYARALRAHFLTQLAIAVVALQDIDVDEAVRVEIVSLHEAVMNGSASVEEVTKCTALVEIMEKFNTLLNQAASISHTAQLWVQYYHQVASTYASVCLC